LGRQLGLIDERRWMIYCTKQQQIEAEKKRLESTRLKESDPAAKLVVKETDAPIKGSITLADLLRRPGVHSDDLIRHGLSFTNLPQDVHEGVEIDIKYSGYLARQLLQVERIKKQANRKLPANINYSGITTLSKEAREKLGTIQPTTLGQAGRIPGVSQADTSALLLWLEIQQRQPSPASKRNDTLS
jgi:tRNA uridine 5-carboxymethylaminomethyl modification enzyme